MGHFKNEISDVKFLFQSLLLVLTERASTFKTDRSLCCTLLSCLDHTYWWLAFSSISFLHGNLACVYILLVGSCRWGKGIQHSHHHEPCRLIAELARYCVVLLLVTSLSSERGRDLVVLGQLNCWVCQILCGSAVSYFIVQWKRKGFSWCWNNRFVVSNSII